MKVEVEVDIPEDDCDDCVFHNPYYTGEYTTRSGECQRFNEVIYGFDKSDRC